ncbi:DUF4871 domain-containing protein [Halobacillus yeomjeoni]|uniref:DUF4871 domain-containing protein n=1 Tax=Halobacillus yeomjeoni TaxID=311194 RepID=UPI001CD781C2|nr:DUF4871 domain-containing protein [Halobacillus yeomjeoni]MCA0983661.1 DUF4871 domain-containing protein [Halobacillus yeomjeoni]
MDRWFRFMPLNMFVLTLTLILTTSVLVSCEESEAGIEQTSNENDGKILDQDQDGWDLSRFFQHKVVYENGEEVSYTIIGNKHTLGFTGPFPIIAADSDKYMWFYFGSENIYDKPVEIKAEKKGSEETIQITSGKFYREAEVAPLEVNMPSNLRFPSSGTWRVIVYIDGEIYEKIVVEVKSQNG